MTINKKIIKRFSLLIVFAMIAPSFSFAGGKVEKEETVYVNLDKKGTPTEKTSSIWLHSDTALGKVEDKSVLKDIKNVKGEEKPKINGDTVLWETDEKDIFYQGEPNEDLPIDMKVEYYLDGKKIDPEKIAGKSGNVKIKLKIDNKDKHTVKLKNGKKKSLATPFVAVSVMNMPIDKFKNVEINNGKLVSDGNNQIVTYVSLPGFMESLDLKKDLVDIPDHLEVKADVKDFQMSPIVITATSDIPEIDNLDGAEDLDELIDGLEKIEEASEKLSEATGKLYTGQISLGDGINELVNGVGKVNTGANILKDGTGKLKDGTDKSYKGSKEISNGAGALSQGADKLGQGTQELQKGTELNRKGANDLSNGLSQLDNKVKNMPEDAKKLDDGMKGVVKGTTEIQQGQEALTKGLGEALEGLEEVKAGKEKELMGVQALLKGMDGLDELAGGIGAMLEKIPGGSTLTGKLKVVLQQEREGLEKLEESSNGLIKGLEDIEEGIKEAKEASEELNAGLKKVNKGQKEISARTVELKKGSKELKGATNQLNAGGKQLSSGANQLNKGVGQVNNGTKGISNGSKELSTGAGKLTNGLGELNNGAGQLYNGTDELSKGTNELSKGGNKLKDGSNKLSDGTKELDEGMNKFHKEGISEISSRIDESDLDIDTIMETKDELMDLSKEYKSFTGLNEEMEGNVKFVIKTEEIKTEEKKEELDTETEEEEKGGFINWIKNLFRKNK